MPPTCSLCRHAARAEIDAALVSPVEPLRLIASRHGTSTASLRRHREHLPRALVVAVEAAASSQADTLLEKVHIIEADARRLLATAERQGDVRAAVMAAKMSLDVIELLYKLREAEREATPAATWEEVFRRLEGRTREERLEDLKRTLEALPYHDLEDVVPEKIRTLAGFVRGLADWLAAEPAEDRIRRVRADLLELPPAERLAVIADLSTAAPSGAGTN